MASTLPASRHPTPCAMRFSSNIGADKTTETNVGAGIRFDSKPAGARAAYTVRFVGGAGGMIWPINR